MTEVLSEEVVSSGRAPTPAGTSVFTKHNFDMEMGYLWLNGWGTLTGWSIYGRYDLMDGTFISLNGWGIYDLMCLFLQWLTVAA